MRLTRTKLILITLLFTAAGCSGGGGDDGGGSKGNAQTGVRVLHAAVDLPPVTLTSSARIGEIVLQTRFSEETGFSELPEGDQSITVQSVDGGTGPFVYSVSVKKRRSAAKFWCLEVERHTELKPRFSTHISLS